MAFPSLRPTNREFNPGNWPTKTFNSQSGAETRILYGTQRTNAKLQLGYANVSDTNAQLFLDDYNANFGTLRKFTIPAETRTGWEGTGASIDAPPGTQWRYESPPSVQSISPGRSSVTVNLIAVI